MTTDNRCAELIVRIIEQVMANDFSGARQTVATLEALTNGSPKNADREKILDVLKGLPGQGSLGISAFGLHLKTGLTLAAVNMEIDALENDRIIRRFVVADEPPPDRGPYFCMADEPPPPADSGSEGGSALADNPIRVGVLKVLRGLSNEGSLGITAYDLHLRLGAPIVEIKAELYAIETTGAVVGYVGNDPMDQNVYYCMAGDSPRGVYSRRQTELLEDRLERDIRANDLPLVIDPDEVDLMRKSRSFSAVDNEPYLGYYRGYKVTVDPAAGSTGHPLAIPLYYASSDEGVFEATDSHQVDIAKIRGYRLIVCRGCSGHEFAKRPDQVLVCQHCQTKSFVSNNIRPLV